MNRKKTMLYIYTIKYYSMFKKNGKKNTAIIKWLEWKIIIKADGPGIERQETHILFT